jgi:hypothetical protein
VRKPYRRPVPSLVKTAAGVAALAGGRLRGVDFTPPPPAKQAAAR